MISPVLKFLTICHGGNVRSRSMAYILMERHKQDAISLGAGYQPATIAKLCDAWPADRIIVMQPQFMNAVPAQHRSKARVCDVGEDNYGTPWNFVLIDKCAAFAKEWAARAFAL